MCVNGQFHCHDDMNYVGINDVRCALSIPE